ncbi:coronin [Babesia caballi]|uniref:Coronin n=1 Tax=Babesia caballi TaxID=5871 RepID=A0AAV4LN75_BABCB|nr:coronin [Babesia caballi]
MAKPRNDTITGEPFKQAYFDLKLNPKPTAFSGGMAASNTHIAFPWEVGGGGLITLIESDKLGRNSGGNRINLKGHTGPLQDICFNDFDFNVLASASDDGTVKVWRVPNEPEATFASSLSGHVKKTTNVVWNSATDYVLLSGGLDNTVRVWNVQKEAEIVSVPIEGQYSYCNWSYDGELLLAASKEAGIFLADPREGKISHSFKAHESNKATSVICLGGSYGSDHLATTGYVGNQTRQIRVWDSRNTEQPLVSKDIDSAPGPLIPHWDSATGLLTVVGKGDLTVRIFQYLEGDLNRAGEIKCSGTIKSFCFVPETACDKSKCELGRLLYNSTCKEINPISVVVMRRNSEAAMGEIYGSLRPRRRTLASEWHGQDVSMSGAGARESFDQGEEAAVSPSAQVIQAPPATPVTPCTPAPTPESVSTPTGRIFGEICSNMGAINQRYQPAFDDVEMIEELETLKSDVDRLIEALKDAHHISDPVTVPRENARAAAKAAAPKSDDEGEAPSAPSGLSGRRVGQPARVPRRSPPEEEREVGGAEPRHGGARRADGRVEDDHLLLLQLDDALLDRVPADEPHGVHGLGLPDAVGALDGLQLGGRVPPGVHEEDAVGDLEVEALAAGHEADEQDAEPGVVVELEQHVPASVDGGGADEDGAGHAGGAEAKGNQLEHGAVLREDEALVGGGGEDLGDLGEEGLDLGARLELAQLEPLQNAAPGDAAGPGAVAALGRVRPLLRGVPQRDVRGEERGLVGEEVEADAAVALGARGGEGLVDGGLELGLGLGVRRAGGLHGERGGAVEDEVGVVHRLPEPGEQVENVGVVVEQGPRLHGVPADGDVHGRQLHVVGLFQLGAPEHDLGEDVVLQLLHGHLALVGVAVGEDGLEDPLVEIRVVVDPGVPAEVAALEVLAEELDGFAVASVLVADDVGVGVHFQEADEAVDVADPVLQRRSGEAPPGPGRAEA